MAQDEESKDNNSALATNNNSNNFIINIREISSYTEKNMIALLSSNDEVQVKKSMFQMQKFNQVKKILFFQIK